MRDAASRNATLWIIIIGLIMLLVGAKFPSMLWIGINWGSFFSDLGLYVAVVVALQWYYDKRTKDEMVVSVVEAALSNSNVVRSGIENFTQDTKQIDYNSLLSHGEEVTIGFLHSSRLVDDNFDRLTERAMSGKKTTILLSDPKGAAIKYLLTLTTVKDHVIPSIQKVIARVDEHINRRDGVKEKINVKHHDAVLRYSFVHSREGIWVKMYRNSAGMGTTPGIYIRSGSPLYNFFNSDIQTLRKGAKNG